MGATLGVEQAAVKYLAEHTDADINLPNKDGVTPFQAACSNNRVDVVTYLASDSRVDTAASSSRGQSAFFQACRSVRVPQSEVLHSMHEFTAARRVMVAGGTNGGKEVGRRGSGARASVHSRTSFGAVRGM